MPEFSTDHFVMRLDTAGFVHLSFLSETTVTRELAVATVAVLEELTGGRPMPLLIDLTYVRAVNLEARQYYASSPAASAQVLIASSPFSAVLGFFFIRVSHPKAPTRLFTSEAEALDWLREYL